MSVDLGGSVTSLIWDPLADAAVVGIDDGRICRVALDGCWSCDDHHHKAAVVALAVDPVLGLVASADAQGTVRLHAGQGHGTKIEMGSRVRSLAWAPGRQQLAIISQAAGLVVIDLRGNRCVGLPPSRRIRVAAWHEDNPIAPLIVGGAGGVSWVDPATDEPIRRRDASAGAVIAVATDPAGPWIAFGDLRGEVRLIDGRTGDETEVSGWPDAVGTIAWLPGRAEAVVAGGDEATIWAAGPDPEDAPLPPRHALPCQRITAVAPHPWRPLVALGGDAAERHQAPVTCWNVEVDAAEAEVHVVGDVTALAWDGLGEHLLAGTRSGRVDVIR